PDVPKPPDCSISRRSSLAFTFFLLTTTPRSIISTLSLHDALPILHLHQREGEHRSDQRRLRSKKPELQFLSTASSGWMGFEIVRSEEHTSELQSLAYLVCRLLLEKKNHLKLSVMRCKPHCNALLLR